MDLQICETHTQARNTLQLAAKTGKDSLSSGNPFSSPPISLQIAKTEKKIIIKIKTFNIYTQTNIVFFSFTDYVPIIFSVSLSLYFISYIQFEKRNHDLELKALM